MAATYFRNMLYLHRYKIIIGLVLLLFSARANAQEAKIVVKNLPNYDNKKMHYGMYFGGVSTRFTVKYSKDYVDSIAYRIANPKSTVGFNIGFVLSRRLGDYFTLRFLPGAGFYTRQVEYEHKGVKSTQEVPATTIQLPFLVKYYAKRRKNSRMYFVAGATPSYDVGGSKPEERVDNKLRADRNNFSIEYGVGLDLFYPFFKFAPELRVSHGLSNVLIPDPNTYSRSFESMKTNSVTLYLLFE